MSARPPVKVAIVGCGAVTQQMYAVHLPQIPSLCVVMVSDLRPENAAAAAALLQCATGTADEAIAAADLVIIATPPRSHRDLALRALEAGRDVCVEKPFTISAEDARQLVALAQRLGRRLYVAQFRRLYPKVGLARRLLLSGLFGRIVRLEMYEGARFNWETSSDYTSRDLFGGVLFDTGAHTLDMGLFATGLDREDGAVEVLAVKRDQGEPSHEIFAIFRLRSGSDTVEAKLGLSRIQNLANLVRVTCERGAIEFDVGHTGAVWLRGTGERFAVFPDEVIEAARHAFTLQFHQLTTQPDSSPLAAAGFVNQIAILEAVHRYE